MTKASSYLRTLELVAAAAATVVWFGSAASSVPTIEPTLEGLQRIGQLTVALQNQASWNRWAALLTAVATGAAVVAEILKRRIDDGGK